jgi:hypothetical protein
MMKSAYDEYWSFHIKLISRIEKRLYQRICSRVTATRMTAIRPLPRAARPRYRWSPGVLTVRVLTDAVVITKTGVDEE